MRAAVIPVCGAAGWYETTKKGCHHKVDKMLATVLAILERLKFKKNFLPVNHFSWQDNTFQNSMAPPVWNPFRRPCFSTVIILFTPSLLWFCVRSKLMFTIAKCPLIDTIRIKKLIKDVAASFFSKTNYH